MGLKRLVGGRAFVACTALCVSFAAPGCGCSDDSESSAAGGTGGSGATGSGATGGTAGASTGGTAGTDGGEASIEINKAADAPNAFDATPDPDGENVYFTANDPTQGPGVFKSPAGGGAVTTLHAGEPFHTPFGIATSSDGQKLYVVDPASEWTPSGADEAEETGQIFELSASGGAPSPLAGTTGMRPQGLEVREENGADQIYFSGVGADGQPGVFRVAAAGGSAEAVASGTPFVDPSGVAVAANGDVFVADSRGAGTNRANVLLVKGGQASEFATDLNVGFPVGIALTADDSTLLVSGLDPETLTDVVYKFDIASKASSTYIGNGTIDISQFEESAGLHRAKNTNVFAWADSKANGGTVYVVTIK